jgi:hypothetical protein
MKPQWTGLLRDWNTDLLWWLRHGGPKLIAILVGMFVLIRLLRLITDKVVALSKRKSISSVARTQQIRTVTGVIHSAGVFVIVFVAFMQAQHQLGSRHRQNQIEEQPQWNLDLKAGA